MEIEEGKLYCNHCGGVFTPDMHEELCPRCEEIECYDCGTKGFPEDMCNELCGDCYDERERN